MHAWCLFILHSFSYKKNADAQKSIKTAEKELQKVDKQLTVIHEQTEAARIKHRELILELRVSCKITQKCVLMLI